MAQLVKNPPAMWETWVLSLGWEDLLEKGKITHSNVSESINFSELSLLYGPNLTTVHDYWKNHRFDYMDICLQCDVSAF